MDTARTADRPPVATTTAGLRGTVWDPARMPEGVRTTVHPLSTADGAQVIGYLMHRGGERTVVCAMHPRELTVPQYMAAEVLRGGCAFWVQGSRSPNSDLRLEHETALLDLAAGQRFLRAEGFARTVLQGTSGGGPLAAFYCQQAARAPEARITRTPGGRPVNLAGAELPEPDGVILISTHLGQGPLLMASLDPSVMDEDDPFATDPALDPFAETNGFCDPPQSSCYAPAFVSRYRAAQRRRVEGIDARARALLARKAEARKRAKAGDGGREARILAALAPTFTVWRTDADLRCFDLSLEPSDRAFGSLWGADPIVSNYGSLGFARQCTPESWLSNWSALSSNATMEKCGPELRQPVCLVQYTGDNSVFDGDVARLLGWLGATDCTHHRVPGNHHGRPVRKGEPNGQHIAGEIIRTWLSDRGFC